jgi:Ferritin-like domain
VAETGRAAPVPRRDFVVRIARAAGVAPAVLGLLEGTLTALPRSEDTDFALLYAALALEHHAIAVYDQGLKSGLVPPGLRDYAVEFRGDHQGHRDTQIAIAEERGGRPPAPLDHYAMGPLRSADDLIREALLVEEAAQRAYLAVISQIRTQDYLLSAAFILVDEVRHMTVWRRVLGLKIY